MSDFDKWFEKDADGNYRMRPEGLLIGGEPIGHLRHSLTHEKKVQTLTNSAAGALLLEYLYGIKTDPEEIGKSYTVETGPRHLSGRIWTPDRNQADRLAQHPARADCCGESYALYHAVVAADGGLFRIDFSAVQASDSVIDECLKSPDRPILAPRPVIGATMALGIKRRDKP